MRGPSESIPFGAAHGRDDLTSFTAPPPPAPPRPPSLVSSRTKGRLELQVVETCFRLPQLKHDDDPARQDGGGGGGVVHGERALPNEGESTLVLHPLWAAPRPVPFEQRTTDGHGGGDERMLSQIFVRPPPPIPPPPRGLPPAVRFQPDAS